VMHRHGVIRRVTVRVAGIVVALGLVTQLVPTWGLHVGPPAGLVNRSYGIDSTVGGSAGQNLGGSDHSCGPTECQDEDPAH